MMMICAYGTLSATVLVWCTETARLDLIWMPVTQPIHIPVNTIHNH